MFSSTVAGAKLVNCKGAAGPLGYDATVAVAEDNVPVVWTRAKLERMMASVFLFCATNAFETATVSVAISRAGAGDDAVLLLLNKNQTTTAAARMARAAIHFLI